jgi:hypothetical protein
MRRSPLPFALVALAAAVVALASAPAWAQSAGVNTGGPRNGQQGYLGAELALGQIDEDFFTLLNLSFGLRMEVPRVTCPGLSQECKTRLHIALGLPLRLRTIDRAPAAKRTLRQEDWDETGDYFRVIRFIEYGYPQETLHLRIGELGGAVLGHGTVMNRYFNVINVDHYQLGMHVNVNGRHGGLQMILDHVVDPEVVALRAYSRPWALLAPDSWMERYAVGLSVALDLDAPLAFERRNVLDDPNTPYVVDKARNLRPSRSEITGVLSLDQELLLVDDKVVDFTAFLDLNKHLDGGAGLHLGAMTNLRPSRKFELHTRTELRWLGEQYIPDYFSSTYEIERDIYFGFGGQGDPKLVRLKGLEDGSSVGAYGEVTFDVIDVMALTLAYEDYQGPDNSGLLLRLALPQAGPLSAAAFYRKVGFDNLEGALNPRDGLLVAEGRYHFLPFLYALGQYSWMWRIKDQEGLAREGSPYRSVNIWFMGVGSSLGF